MCSLWFWISTWISCVLDNFTQKKGTKSFLYEISCCNDFPWLFIWNGKHSERISKLDIKFDKKIFLIFFSKKTKTKIQKLILTIAMTMKKMVMVMSIKMAWTNPKMDSGNYLFFRFNSIHFSAFFVKVLHFCQFPSFITCF